MIKSRSISIAASAIIMSLFFGFAFASWQEPAVAPPNGNISAPVNIGSTAQTKAGEFSVLGNFYAPMMYDSDDSGYYVNPAGQTVLSGNVGIGVSSPNNLLQVKDLINFQNSLEGTFLGYQAGNMNTGEYNTAIGYQSLYSNSTGLGNTAIGYKSLYSNSTGQGNIAIGHLSLYNNTGVRNTAIGYSSLYSNTGIDNTAIGWGSLYNNITGHRNTAIGKDSLHFNINGIDNVALGHYSGYYETGSNSFYVDNQDRGSTAGDKTKALLYGTFAAATSSQQLTVNGALNVAGTLTVGGIPIGSGGGGDSYWVQSGSNIYASSTSWNVGVGTATPNNFLQVKDLISFPNAVYGTFLGYQAGNLNTGGGNTAVGYQSLYSNTTGGGNTAIGAKAFYSNITGNLNTAIGNEALFQNTAGYANTAIGIQSLWLNTAGDYNTANGAYSLYSNTAGDYNTANGAYSLYSNTTGYDNVAIGLSALSANTTGYRNTAVGTASLYDNISGYSNVAVGEFALSYNTIGVRNTGIGDSALYNNTQGNNNTGLGMVALFSNTTGSNNTAVGDSALYNNTTADSNTAIGFNSLNFNTTGYQNTAIGRDSLYLTVGGYRNTAIGNTALYSNSSGYRNTAIGDGAGYRVTTGRDNTFLGYNAGNNASQRVNAINSMALGNGSWNTADNQVRIGNTSITWIGGQVTWSTYSDSRLKTDIKDYSHGLDLILKLRPVEFKAKDDSSQKIRSGFIAQEVESIGIPFYGLTKPASDNDFYSLQYSEFVVPLVKSVQEQQKQIEDLKIEINQLKTELKNLRP
ncbi:MAG: tail fiber domain-containing protein [Candidatus Paceibacterota bacterium]|jgi:hypothetical protein